MNPTRKAKKPTSKQVVKKPKPTSKQVVKKPKPMKKEGGGRIRIPLTQTLRTTTTLSRLKQNKINPPQNTDDVYNTQYQRQLLKAKEDYKKLNEDLYNIRFAKYDEGQIDKPTTATRKTAYDDTQMPIPERKIMLRMPNQPPTRKTTTTATRKTII
jgi:hypothetical protein|uniref:Uncharacterized protein n=1 Tax=viral metagenome TaxID=1070528 RepID=A0A6C0LL92_9ZZZZ